VAKAQKAAAHLLADPLTVRLLRPSTDLESPLARIPAERGGSDLATKLMIACAARPNEPISRDRVRVLPRLGVERAEFEAWWRPHLESAFGSAQEIHWLELGACFPNVTLDTTASNMVTLDSPVSRRAVIALNARPTTGSSTAEALVRSVLDGEASDTPAKSTSTAGELLKVLRPQHYLRLAKKYDAPLFLVPTGHLSDIEADRKARSSIFKRLEAVEPRYKRIMRASAVRMGEKGTTAPWQHTAREVAAIHGNCLLAAEIAVIGAAQFNIKTGGSITSGAPAFGISADYAMLVQETRHHRSSGDWWKEQVFLCDDDLSRTTWALALLAVADPVVVQGGIAFVDQLLDDIGEEQFFAAAQSSSRLGASGLARRLPETIWTAGKFASTRTQVLLAHHSASLSSLDALPALSEAQLGQLARYNHAAWPAVRAITARLLERKDEITSLLQALEACDPEAPIKVPAAPTPSATLADAILSRPEVFPLGWIVAAEHWRSTGNVEPPLAVVAIEQKWVPDI
jgi:hypothetical protein